MEACDLRWTLPSLDLQMVESRRRRVMMILLWFSFLPAQRRRALIDCRPINNALFKYDSLMLLFFIFPFLFSFIDCHFGKKVYELEERWNPDLGSPFGVMYCIRCECIAVSVSFFLSLTSARGQVSSTANEPSTSFLFVFFLSSPVEKWPRGISPYHLAP